MDRYEIATELGVGSFGTIYAVVDKKSNKTYAAKVEPKKCRFPQLRFEYNVYQAIKNGNGIPRIHAFGNVVLSTRKCKALKEHRMMVVDKLGPSLEMLFWLCNRKFSLKTVAMIGIQLLNRLEHLHKCGFIHRDIKPDNFLIGDPARDRKSLSLVYMIDLGLCKKWWVDGKHVPYREGKSLTGTPRYTSINTHKGISQSRRDDLEAVGYMLLYFLRGKLPWQGTKAATKQEMYQEIGRIKLNSKISDLCKDLPPEIEQYITQVRNLSFTESPNYHSLRSLYKRAIDRSGQKIDWEFDWMKLPIDTLRKCGSLHRKNKNKKTAGAGLKRKRDQVPAPGGGIRPNKKLMVRRPNNALDNSRPQQAATIPTKQVRNTMLAARKRRNVELEKNLKLDGDGTGANARRIVHVPGQTVVPDKVQKGYNGKRVDRKRAALSSSVLRPKAELVSSAPQAVTGSALEKGIQIMDPKKPTDVKKMAELLRRTEEELARVKERNRELERENKILRERVSNNKLGYQSKPKYGQGITIN